MICIIRIRGDVKLDGDIRETFNRMHLRRKYSCIVINPNKEQLGMIKKLEDFTAFGEIRKDIFEKLIDIRGERIGGKSGAKKDSKKVVEEVEKGKSYQSLGFKPFFRLHPPRGGIKSSKRHFPRGVLGNNGEKINDLLLRML